MTTAHIVNAGLIPHSTAAEMARQFEQCTGRIRELIIELGEQCEGLKTAFMMDTHYDFRVDLKFFGSEFHPDATAAEKIIDAMQRTAWRCLIEKLGIRKLMSSERQREMDEQLDGQPRRYGTKLDPLPPITEDSILSVLNGFCQSADEFLAEAIREEYDWLKPGMHDGFKTNQGSEFRLGEKLIKEYAVDAQYSGSGFHVQYSTQPHLNNLENIFRMLDGQGPYEGHRSELVNAINQAATGTTTYFEFKCFKKGTLHLRFTRIDLVDKFNHWCGRNRLDKPRA